MAQTQRIARSYLTDLFDHARGDIEGMPEELAAYLMGEAATVDYQPRRDRLVLTFDLAEKEQLPQAAPDPDWIGREDPTPTGRHDALLPQTKDPEGT